MNIGKTFTLQKNLAADGLEFALAGTITEDSDFAYDSLAGHATLVISFEKVDYANSNGIRQLMLWLWSLSENNPATKISIGRVTPVVLRSFNSFKTTFPANLSVTSAFVPFYCEICDRDDGSVLVNSAMAADRWELESKIDEACTCPSCGKKMIPDVDVDSYLVLLDGRPK